MKVERYDQTGSKAGQVELPGGVFAAKISAPLIQQTIRTELRNRRQGTHKTKTVGEIRGGGKKPWRQKGTGNARQGSIRSTQWRGGQTVFGPRPRDYRIDLPRKMRHAGIRSILSRRVEDKAVVVMEDMALTDFKTRTIADAFEKAGFLPGNTITYVTAGANEKLEKSIGGLETVRFIHAERLTAPELYYCSRLILSDSAVKYIGDAYGAGAKK